MMKDLKELLFEKENEEYQKYAELLSQTDEMKDSTCDWHISAEWELEKMQTKNIIKTLVGLLSDAGLYDEYTEWCERKKETA